MKQIIHLISDHQTIKDFSLGKVSFSHLSLTQEALLIAASYKNFPRSMIIIKSNLYLAQQLFEKIQFWLDQEVVLYPVEESLRVESIAASPEMAVIKMDTLSRLNNESNLICVTHLGAALRYTPNPEYFKENKLILQLNQRIQLKELKEKLYKLGYQVSSRVDVPNTYAARGGVVDVFPINSNDPVRIEFFDDEIDSIRTFDLSSQRTIESIDSIHIQPCSDLLFSETEVTELELKAQALLNQERKHKSEEFMLELEENIQRDLDLIQKGIKENHLYRYRALLSKPYRLVDYIQNPHVFLSTTEDLEEHEKRLSEESLDYLVELNQNAQALPQFSVFMRLTELLAGVKRIDFRRFETKSNQAKLPFREIDVPDASLIQHAKDIKRLSETKKVICCLKENEIKLLIPMLVDFKIPYSMRYKEDQNQVLILHQDLDEGFEFLDANVIVYSSKELFKHKVHVGKYQSKFKEAETLSAHSELQVGDYVVHHQYGVGQYMGTITKEFDGIHRDFLHIVYRDNSNLYVPLEQFQLVRKFVSRDGVVPKLNRLGTNEWKKTKAKIKENVRDIADRLISLYSVREQDIAYQFAQDNPLQKEFEAEFEFELTHDQATAIKDIKADMQSTKPMDRLLCGDVGFGKTEVAIRAAFKAISEHKQVAFLCPTTVLSQQHFRTFSHRFENYPVKIAVLNRFVPDSHVKEILKEVEAGQIDVLIGTHRLLSKDVRFKDLALLIIDEEQRFGVEHKEKIKEVRQSVHVLSLSATPIPRTLQMSLVGVRQLSQLESPPLNRLPVLTYVIQKNDNIVKDVIERELSRHGQVFYLYNNVSDIHSIAMKLQQALPQAKVGIAHGQMHRDDIEDVMLQFTSNQINVLVCTTIVETGIDIPNANTMIIDRADTFGLSQLYQIKGRVGRSDRLAYAYLMYNPKKQLTEIAQKRLQSIKEFTELGSGYKIAMRDLTIRGAGEMLGDNQSGFIDTVGIDMYIEMLQQAIEERRTGIIHEEVEPEIKQTLAIDGYIPQQFETNDFEKLSLYQRIDKTQSAQALDELLDETNDLYGKLPKSVILLFEKKRWELLLNNPDIKQFKEIKHQLTITFSENWSSLIDGVKVFEIISKLSSTIQLKYANQSIILTIPKEDEWLSLSNRVLEALKDIPLKGVKT